MKRYNLIVIFNESMDRVLLCRRRKDPYQGLSNFIGGKIEEGESGQAAAYREMEEESGLTGKMSPCSTSWT
ncbi:NUDIX hydrolase [Rossellomorea sp. H39__3]